MTHDADEFDDERPDTVALAAFTEVELDLSGSGEAWGHCGGRPLDRLVQDARRSDGV